MRFLSLNSIFHGFWLDTFVYPTTGVLFHSRGAFIQTLLKIIQRHRAAQTPHAHIIPGIALPKMGFAVYALRVMGGPLSKPLATQPFSGVAGPGNGHYKEAMDARAALA